MANVPGRLGAGPSARNSSPVARCSSRTSRANRSGGTRAPSSPSSSGGMPARCSSGTVSMPSRRAPPSAARTECTVIVPLAMPCTVAAVERPGQWC